MLQREYNCSIGGEDGLRGGAEGWGLYTSMIAFETIKQGWVEILSDKKNIPVNSLKV